MNVIEIISRQFCLTQFDLTIIRLVCSSWKNQVSIVWQDYCNYACKRTHIRIAYPNEMIHYYDKYYVKPNWKLSKFVPEHITPYKNEENNLNYICRHVHHNYVVVSYNGILHKGLEMCDIEDIIFMLDDQMKESDIVVIYGYEAGTRYNILLTMHEGEIQKYGEKTYFPIEEYNINYFYPFVRYMNQFIAIQLMGYLIDYRPEICDVGKINFMEQFASTIIAFRRIMGNM